MAVYRGVFVVGNLMGIWLVCEWKKTVWQVRARLKFYPRRVSKTCGPGTVHGLVLTRQSSIEFGPCWHLPDRLFPFAYEPDAHHLSPYPYVQRFGKCGHGSDFKLGERKIS